MTLCNKKNNTTKNCGATKQKCVFNYILMIVFLLVVSHKKIK